MRCSFLVSSCCQVQIQSAAGADGSSCETGLEFSGLVGPAWGWALTPTVAGSNICFDVRLDRQVLVRAYYVEGYYALG